VPLGRVHVFRAHHAPAFQAGLLPRTPSSRWLSCGVQCTKSRLHRVLALLAQFRLRVISSFLPALISQQAAIAATSSNTSGPASHFDLISRTTSTFVRAKQPASLKRPESTRLAATRTRILSDRTRPTPVRRPAPSTLLPTSSSPSIKSLCWLRDLKRTWMRPLSTFTHSSPPRPLPASRTHPPPLRTWPPALLPSECKPPRLKGKLEGHAALPLSTSARIADRVCDPHWILRLTPARPDILSSLEPLAALCDNKTQPIGASDQA
jgi:hypothetical protein